MNSIAPDESQSGGLIDGGGYSAGPTVDPSPHRAADPAHPVGPGRRGAARGTCRLPGYRLHPLTGDRRGQWSVRVSGELAYRLPFEDGVAVDVTLIDYH